MRRHFWKPFKTFVAFSPIAWFLMIGLAICTCTSQTQPQTCRGAERIEPCPGVQGARRSLSVGVGDGNSRAESLPQLQIYCIQLHDCLHCPSWEE